PRFFCDDIIASLFLGKGKLQNNKRRMRIGGKRIGGTGKIPLLEEQKATGRFVGINDDLVARNSGEILELRYSLGCIVDTAVGRGDAGAFAENGGAIDIAIRSEERRVGKEGGWR